VAFDRLHIRSSGNRYIQRDEGIEGHARLYHRLRRFRAAAAGRRGALARREKTSSASESSPRLGQRLLRGEARLESVGLLDWIRWRTRCTEIR